ncbi:MAG: hypothetical protein JWP87_3849 [Labilithrix sp.]|nr:hypothetical protein [Labilithrix sp.]
MSRFSRALAAFTFATASLTAIPVVHAQGEDTPVPPRAGQDDTRRYVAVTVNPLGLAMQRYGANLEVSPFPHHVLIGSLYSQAVPLWLVKTISGRDEVRAGGTLLGGELGYRLYSGRSGADGLFVGPSFVSMPLAYARVANDLRSADVIEFSAMGAAIDIGAQTVTSSGFTIGGGIGVMYLSYDLPNDNRRLPLTIEPHVLPRLLLAAGWSF